MNKIRLASITLLTILVSLFLISSCIGWDPRTYRFGYGDLKEQIISVEIIDYDNDHYEEVENMESILPFDFNKMKVIEVLDESRLTEFLDDFDELLVYDLGEYAVSPTTGVNLKLTYKSGNFIVISSHSIDLYDSEGQVIYAASGFGGNIRYVDLINKYFEIRIG